MNATERGPSLYGEFILDIGMLEQLLDKGFTCKSERNNELTFEIIANITAGSSKRLVRYFVFKLNMHKMADDMLHSLDEQNKLDLQCSVMWMLSHLVVDDEQVVASFFNLAFKWGF